MPPLSPLQLRGTTENPSAVRGFSESAVVGYLAETAETAMVDVDVVVLVVTGTVAAGTLIAFNLVATFVASISISHTQPRFPASPWAFSSWS
jgi:hypothetical protein